jgi:hypothetical protein
LKVPSPRSWLHRSWMKSLLSMHGVVHHNCCVSHWPQQFVDLRLCTPYPGSIIALSQECQFTICFHRSSFRVVWRAIPRRCRSLNLPRIKVCLVSKTRCIHKVMESLRTLKEQQILEYTPLRKSPGRNESPLELQATIFPRQISVIYRRQFGLAVATPTSTTVNCAARGTRSSTAAQRCLDREK